MNYDNSYKKASSGLNSRGTWNSASTYAVNDLVSYSNSLYECIQDTGTPPAPVNIMSTVVSCELTGGAGNFNGLSTLYDGNLNSISWSVYGTGTFEMDFPVSKIISSIVLHGSQSQFQSGGNITSITMTVNGVNVPFTSVYNTDQNPEYYRLTPTTTCTGKNIVLTITTNGTNAFFSEVEVWAVDPNTPDLNTTDWSWFANADSSMLPSSGDTLTNLTNANAIIPDRQLVVVTDTTPPRLKIGNGTSTFNALPYVAGIDILAATINGSGHLILTFTDSSTLDCGAVSVPWSGVTGNPTTLNEYGISATDTLLTTNFLGINSNAASATKLATGRTIALTGDVTGTSGTFDGTGNLSFATTLPSVATAGTYFNVTVNAKGQVTAGSNPTTLAGYNISDAYTNTVSDGKYATLGANSNITSLTGLTTALSIGQGGTGAATQQLASNAIHGAVTNATFARGNGTNVVMAAISASDVPTLNQNTTGSSGSCTGNALTATTAGNITGIAAIANGGTGATTAAGIMAIIIASLPAYYQRDIAWSSNRTTIISPNSLTVNINNSGYILTVQQTISLATAVNWDSTATDYTVAANRAGNNFYIYACQPSSGTTPVIVLSANSTVPTGYTATNSRKIGGFHCLCLAVGTISGHTLSGYSTGDILPASVWDLNFKPVSAPEGMVYDSNTNRWVDIYLASVSGSTLVSTNNGVTADGTSSPVAFHWYNGSDWISKAKKNLLSQREFVSASIGSNQGTNIAGSNDPNTTGGHVDTSGRRMISNIGCEDMCGALWQWGSEAGGPYGTAAWKSAFDGNDTGVGGQSYQEPDRVLLGGHWIDGALCGSRGSNWGSGPLLLGSYIGLRGKSENISK